LYQSEVKNKKRPEKGVFASCLAERESAIFKFKEYRFSS
jgi:hypothetical protein